MTEFPPDIRRDRTTSPTDPALQQHRRPRILHSITHSARGRRPLGEHGRSFIEMCVALSIVIGLGAVAAPLFSNILQEYALRGATQDVFAQLQKARMGAVMENHRFNVTLTDSTHYTVHDDTNSNGTVDTGETVTTVDITKNGTGVALSPAGTTITFAPDSTAPAYGNITVQGVGISHAVVVSRGGSMRIQ